MLALIDGERFNFGEGLHDGNIYWGGVKEQIIFPLTKEQMQKIANGKSVEIRLGRFERKLKPDVLERFKGLLMLTDPDS